MSRPRLHGDAVLIQSDHVGRDLRPVAVRLLPLQEQAGGGRVARFRGGRDVQEGQGGDRVGVRRRSPEADLLAVRTRSCLIHRLGNKRRGRREMEKNMLKQDECQEKKNSFLSFCSDERLDSLKQNKGFQGFQGYQGNDLNAGTNPKRGLQQT